MHELEPSKGLFRRSLLVPRILLSFLAMTVGMCLFIPTSVLSIGVDSPLLAIIAVFATFALGIVLVIGVNIGLGPISKQIRLNRVGELHLFTSKHPLAVGAHFDITFEQQLPKERQIAGMTFKLVLREIARYRVGTDTRTVSHDHIIQTVERMGGSYASSRSIIENASFDIPAGGMHSFPQPNNRLIWMIEVNVTVSNGPNVNEQYILEVEQRLIREEDRVW
ncbi:MAG: hypothetical protein GYB68_17050 [Chloroflexi bacterium]|nr:hypothetical protein [Chloroflexota bacterium]